MAVIVNNFIMHCIAYIIRYTLFTVQCIVFICITLSTKETGYVTHCKQKWKKRDYNLCSEYNFYIKR